MRKVSCMYSTPPYDPALSLRLQYWWDWSSYATAYLRHFLQGHNHLPWCICNMQGTCHMHFTAKQTHGLLTFTLCIGPASGYIPPLCFLCISQKCAHHSVIFELQFYANDDSYDSHFSKSLWFIFKSVRNLPQELLVGIFFLVMVYHDVYQFDHSCCSFW